MFQNIIFLLLSFVGLHVGSGLLISSSERLAIRYMLPAWLTSGLLLSLGTSLPEVVVSIAASLNGFQKLAVSQIIGSNIANVCLAMGIPWVFFQIKKYQIPKFFLIEFLVIPAAFVILLCTIGLNYLSGVILLVAFIMALAFKIKNNKQADAEPGPFTLRDTSLLILSLILVPAASHFIVHFSESIIESLNLSVMFFGIVFVALGTSLPEIYATIFAIKRKKYEIAIMNVVGSNIINSSIVASVICFIGGYSITEPREYFDNGFMLAVSLVLFLILFFNRKHKLFGVLLLSSYFVYLYSWI